MIGKLLLKLLQQKLRKPGRGPYVVIRRNVAETWTPEDAMWLNEIMEDYRFQKLLRFSDDAICQDVLENKYDPAYVKAMVAGRLREREYQANHAVSSPAPVAPDPERLDAPEEEARTPEEKNRVTVEMNEDR